MSLVAGRFTDTKVVEEVEKTEIRERRIGIFGGNRLQYVYLQFLGNPKFTHYPLTRLLVNPVDKYPSVCIMCTQYTRYTDYTGIHLASDWRILWV
jgi:hypothetical protein